MGCRVGWRAGGALVVAVRLLKVMIELDHTLVVKAFHHVELAVVVSTVQDDLRKGEPSHSA